MPTTRLLCRPRSPSWRANFDGNLLRLLRPSRPRVQSARPDHLTAAPFPALDAARYPNGHDSSSQANQHSLDGSAGPVADSARGCHPTGQLCFGRGGPSRLGSTPSLDCLQALEGLASAGGCCAREPGRARGHIVSGLPLCPAKCRPPPPPLNERARRLASSPARPKPGTPTRPPVTRLRPTQQHSVRSTPASGSSAPCATSRSNRPKAGLRVSSS